MKIGVRSLQYFSLIRPQGRAICFVFVALVAGISSSRPADGQTLYRHLHYQGEPYFYAIGSDSLGVDAPVTNTNELPAGRYIIADANKVLLGTFETHEVTPPGTLITNVGGTICCDPCNPGFCPYGARDFHAVYLL